MRPSLEESGKKHGKCSLIDRRLNNDVWIKMSFQHRFMEARDFVVSHHILFETLKHRLINNTILTDTFNWIFTTNLCVCEITYIWINIICLVVIKNYIYKKNELKMLTFEVAYSNKYILLVRVRLWSSSIGGTHQKVLRKEGWFQKFAK